MTRAAVENVETGDIVGVITDSNFETSNREFEVVVQNILSPNGKVSTLSYSEKDSEGTISEFQARREPGEDGFGMALLESLPYPYFLYKEKYREELIFPSVTEDNG